MLLGRGLKVGSLDILLLCFVEELSDILRSMLCFIGCLVSQDGSFILRDLVLEHRCGNIGIIHGEVVDLVGCCLSQGLFDLEIGLVFFGNAL